MHCGEALLYPARKQHDADDDQPHEARSTPVIRCMRLSRRPPIMNCIPIPIDVRRRRNTLLSHRMSFHWRCAANPSRQPCYRETYLAGEPPEIGYDLC